MLLERGVSLEAGRIIIGRHPTLEQVEMLWPKILDDVVQTLRVHHDILLRPNASTFCLSRSIGQGQHSTTICQPLATILRIRQGSAALAVAGERFTELETGDWAYIAGGLPWLLTSIETIGPPLRFGYAHAEVDG